MSDLSRMLDDVYAMPESGTVVSDTFPVDTFSTGAFTTDEVPADAFSDELPEDQFPTDELPTRAPEWSSTEALDEAFSAWVPGPADGASALERSMVDEHVEMSFVTEPDVEQWLDETEPVAPVAVIAGPRRWSPSDDDILPTRRGPRRRRR